MSAIADATTSKIRQLDQKAGPGEVVSEADVGDAKKLSELLTRMLKAQVDQGRRFAPQRIDFQDVEVGTGTTHNFPHRFGGRVRWWVVDQIGSIPELVQIDDDSTDDNTLVLYSGVSTRVTIRVEEVG